MRYPNRKTAYRSHRNNEARDRLETEFRGLHKYPNKKIYVSAFADDAEVSESVARDFLKDKCEMDKITWLDYGIYAVTEEWHMHEEAKTILRIILKDKIEELQNCNGKVVEEHIKKIEYGLQMVKETDDEEFMHRHSDSL